MERRAGILKPQGSLEKAREKEAAEVVWNHNQNHGGPAIAKRGRQNVAMQAIMRKSVFLGEQENSRNLEAKQVSDGAALHCALPAGCMSHVQSVRLRSL